MSPRHDLPSELLAIISGRLHDAADYVRFHAVCKPWRESLPALRPIFFPWLVAPTVSRLPLDMKLRCVFSKTSYRAEAPRAGHNCLARPDGTVAWFFSASFENPTLVDPFTGDATVLPPLLDKRGMQNSAGVQYGGGTIFLYNFVYGLLVDFMFLQDDEDEDDEDDDDGIEWQHVQSTRFRVAILRPDDTAWQFVDRRFYPHIEARLKKDLFFAAYCIDNGNTLVHGDHFDDTSWKLLPPPVGDWANEDENEMTWEIPEGEVIACRDWYLESSHVLESRGELLSVSVLIKRVVGKPAPHEVSVLVDALEEEVDADGRHTLRWARREGRRFAVEESRFHSGVDDVTGGSVYFLQRRSGLHGLPLTRPRVFRYNLVDGKAKFVERLPLELEHIGPINDQEFMWLMPRPVIATVQVIRERLESPKTGGPTLKMSIVRMEKPKYSKEPFIRFNVQNLPPSVDSSELLHFFSTHGEVSDPEVTSPSKGYVTMAMTTLYKQHELEDALDGLVLDGFTLEVSEAKMMTGC